MIDYTELAFTQYTQPLTPNSISDDIETQVFGTKKFRGDAEDCDGTLPLSVALLTPWDADAHITQYTSDPPVRCKKANVANYKLKFTQVLFDLDFGEHGKEQPTMEDFAQLVCTLWLFDHVPNIVYPTLYGARIVFLIKPMTDADQFEGRSISLGKTVSEPLTNSKSRYKFDERAKDWGRFYRSARVVRDEVERFDNPVLLYHDRLLNLLTFNLPRPPRRQSGPTTPRKLSNCDPIILGRLSRMREGTRNCDAFYCCCYALKTYNADDANVIIAMVEDYTLRMGLPESEWESIERSARQQPISWGDVPNV
jgi:hypothetical protein